MNDFLSWLNMSSPKLHSAPLISINNRNSDFFHRATTNIGSDSQLWTQETFCNCVPTQIMMNKTWTKGFFVLFQNEFASHHLAHNSPNASSMVPIHGEQASLIITCRHSAERAHNSCLFQGTYTPQCWNKPVQWHASPVEHNAGDLSAQPHKQPPGFCSLPLRAVWSRCSGGKCLRCGPCVKSL